MITDSQVHVWAAPAPGRPWADGGDRYAETVDNLSSAERTPLSPEELLTEMATAGVDRVVLVPPVFEGDRNDIALAAAARWPDRFAVMGRVPLADPSARDLLPGWREQPGMLGVRLTFHWEAQAPWLHDGTADWFWGAAERADLPVMVYAPGGLDRIAEVAAKHESLRIAVDHFALPLSAREPEIPAVVDKLVTLAKLPNVVVKASALPSYCAQPYPFPALQSQIRRVVEAFGPRRVFWGSEMSRLRCSYREAVTLFTEELDFLSEEDLRWIMGDGVSSWLGWPPATGSG